MALFSRRKRDEDGEAFDEGGLDDRSRELSAYVPASAVSPEKQRLTIFDDTEEESDGELAFLNELAAQVERDQRGARKPVRTPARVERVVVAEEQALEVFRELKDRVERTSHADALPLPSQPVEISDLLDDLQTTAAALRQRRAA
jgi:hypothetical protein